MPINKTKKRTFRQRLHSYICKKQDICCEKDIKREDVIEGIIKKYKIISERMDEKDEYLSYINNDLGIFIGYLFELEKNNDIEGQKLWKEIDKKMYENKKMYEKKELSEEKIIALFKIVPLYFLMAFLGYASYKES